jgi:quinol monooxygenase YgiN
MLVPPRKYKEACSALGSMVERIKVKEGCLDCCLYQEAVGGRTILFEMAWADEKSFQAHLYSEEFRYVLMVVEMASSPPEVRFDRVAHSTRINTIEDVWKWIVPLTGPNGLSV